MLLWTYNASVIGAFIGGYAGLYIRNYFLNDNIIKIPIYDMMHSATLAGFICINMYELFDSLSKKK